MQRMVGLVVAVMRGLLPDDFVEHTLDEHSLVEVPKAPAGNMYLAECWFSVAETNSRILLRPRRAVRPKPSARGGPPLLYHGGCQQRYIRTLC